MAWGIFLEGKRHLGVRTEIDSSGMSVFWTTVEYDRFSSRESAISFIDRLKERYPKQYFYVREINDA